MAAPAIASPPDRLAPWRPMRDAPYDRPLLLLVGGHRVIGKWSGFYQGWITAEISSRIPETIEPGGWFELPALPSSMR